MENYTIPIYINDELNKVKTPANTRVISDESKIHPKNTKNKFGILGRVFMLLDLLKITNKVILSTIEDNVKPIVNVWFKKNKVIEETSHKRAQQIEEEKMEMKKVENIHWPYSETP
jgi:hypothetical protein